MDKVNMTENGTRTKSGYGQGKDKSKNRFELLTPEQKFADTILSVGIYPTLCLLGLVACAVYLHAVWRKRGNRATNHLPIFVAVFDAVYLILTLLDRIEYSLSMIFLVLPDESIAGDIRSSLKIVAKFAISVGTVILCVHSIEVCYAVLRPVNYSKVWTRKTRLITAASSVTLCLVYHVTCQIVYLTNDNIGHKFRDLLDDLVFSILSISIMLFCYIIVIVKRSRQILFKSTTRSFSTNDSTNRMIKSLILAGSVYLILGIPVDIANVILVLSIDVRGKGITNWVIMEIQKVMEAAYGSTLLCVYLLNEGLSANFPNCCTRQLQSTKQRGGKERKEREEMDFDNEESVK